MALVEYAGTARIDGVPGTAAPVMLDFLDVAGSSCGALFPTGNLVMYDTTLGWRFVNPKMQALYGTESMGETAENLAEMYGIRREEQDRFALLSHQKAVRAWEEGRFQDEVVPVPVKRGKEEILVEQDEGPRRDTSLEKLAALRPGRHHCQRRPGGHQDQLPVARAHYGFCAERNRRQIPQKSGRFGPSRCPRGQNPKGPERQV